ncbi:MAG: hypothetical protein ACO1PW_00180 [Actinomycetota bacterium]
MQRAASWAALAALVALVGAAAFFAAREDAGPPPTTTSTTTTTVVTEAAVAAAIAESLQTDLTVAITAAEADCVAEGLVALVPPSVLVQLVERDEPLTGVPPEDREALVQLVVSCLPEASAAALLGSGATTTTIGGLPDEG